VPQATPPLNPELGDVYIDNTGKFFRYTGSVFAEVLDAGGLISARNIAGDTSGTAVPAGRIGQGIGTLRSGTGGMDILQELLPLFLLLRFQL
jgi:hypothetical protein